MGEELKKNKFELAARKKPFLYSETGDRDLSNQKKNTQDVDFRENPNEGQKLLDQVVSLTGLPEDLISSELDEILENSGRSAKNVTLEELRAALIAHLESVNRDMQSRFSD